MHGIGAGFRIAATNAHWAWPLLFAVDLAVRLPLVRGILPLIADRPREEIDGEDLFGLGSPLAVALGVFAQLLPLLLGAALLAGAFGRARRREPRAIGPSLRSGLLAVRTPFLIAGIVALGAGLMRYAIESIAVAGALGALVGWIFLARFVTRAALAAPAAACERLAPGAALTRSARLLAGAAWRVFGLLLLFLIAWSMLRTTVQLFLFYEAGWWIRPEGSEPWRLAVVLWIELAGAALDSLVSLHFAAITGALYDVAREREGRSIEELGRTFA
jgi:hypothetical protein